MTVIQATHGFHTEQDGDKIHFIYEMEKYKLKDVLPSLFGAAFLAIIPLIFIQPKKPINGIILWLVFTFSIVYLIKYLVNLNRKQRSFSMTPEAFIVNDKTYLRKDVTGIFYQQGKKEVMPSPYSNGSTVIVGGSVVKSMMASSAANLAGATGRQLDIAGAKFKNNLARLNCKVIIRYGNKNIVLAKGISIDTAELILNKIATAQ